MDEACHTLTRFQIIERNHDFDVKQKWSLDNGHDYKNCFLSSKGKFGNNLIGVGVCKMLAIEYVTKAYSVKINNSLFLNNNIFVSIFLPCF